MIRQLSPLFVSVLLLGCSSEDNPFDAGFDVSRVDSQQLDLFAPDASPAATPTTVASGWHQVMGLTSDDKIIAQAPNDALIAIPVTGGDPEIIASSWTNESIRDKVVFVWTRSSADAKVGKLAVWAAGATKPVASTSIVGTAATTASRDGTFIVYTENASADASAADLYVAKADGTQAHMLVRPSFSACSPSTSFTSSGQVFLSYCEEAVASPDGGSTPDAGASPDGGPSPERKLAFADPATGVLSAIVTLPPGARYVARNKAGTQLVVRDAVWDIWLYESGAAPIKIDSNIDALTTFGDVTLLYITGTSALKRATLASPPVVTTLVPSGVTSLLPHAATGSLQAYAVASLSPDHELLIVRTARLATGSYVGPIALASTGTPGPPEPLHPAGTMMGEPFSGDGQLLTYDTDFQPTVAANAGVTTVWAKPVAGGAARQVATEVWAHYFGKGQRLVWTDNYVQGSPQGTADLKWQDLALSASKPQTLAKQADEKLYFDSSRDRLIYSISAPSSQAGIYVVTLP